MGVTFASFQNLGLDAAMTTASWARELGLASYWTAETTGPEAFATLAAVGAREPDLDLGTGVLALQLRTPMVVAMGAATLQSLHPERDILVGVGISSPVVTEKWHGAPYGDRPLARVREYVALLRACLDGDAVSFDGDFFRASKFRLGVRLGERKPKIVLGALNEHMLRLAGEVADGVLLNYLPASHVAWAVERVREGEARSGNRCTVYGYVHVGVAERDEKAVDYARRDLFSYAVVDGYAKNFSKAGFAADVELLRARHAERDRDGALAAISVDMIDAIDIVGDADHVPAAVQAYVDAGVDVPVIMPLPWGDDRAAVVHDTMRAVVGAA
jgi:probable F420-dependent oxidoreductase